MFGIDIKITIKRNSLNLPIYLSYQTFVYVIAVLYAGITGILHNQRDMIAVLLIFVVTGIVNSILFFINSEYHQKYELYGVSEKDKSAN